MMKLILKTTCLLIGLALSPLSQAVDKALLIGVSDYKSSAISDLPGITLDLDMMYLTAQRLGFARQNIKRLEDAKSSHANIKKMITGWLSHNVNKDDRVLIYYSGHGSQIPDANNDESDGMDEVLVSYDADIVQGEDYSSLKNVVVDDELYQWLAKIPSERIYFYVDACNSGTAYKSINLGGKNGNNSLNLKEKAQVKFLDYPKMLKIRHKENKGMAKDLSKSLPNVMFLSAAKDTEFALATPKGSVFTLGLDSIIESALIKNEKLTPKMLHSRITTFVEEKIQSEKMQGKVHHPQLTAGNTLKNENIFPRAVTDNTTQVARRVGKEDFDRVLAAGINLDISSKKTTLKLKDVLKFKIDIPKEGWYLNIVYVGTDGARTVLFPNKLENDNQVKKGIVTIPGKKMPFDIRASRPIGPSYVYAFLTEHKLNFYQDSIDGFDKDGKKNAFLSGVSAQATRGLEITSRYYAGTITINVK
ncbi:MAG TPA: DUF4384 domain-containing protein [Aeromonadales bacterium]|nr:DUF4384 domain-containing protein [Aeromonadales bacterium]